MDLSFEVSNGQVWIRADCPRSGLVLTFSAVGPDWVSSRASRLLSKCREFFPVPELEVLWGDGPLSRPAGEFVHIRSELSSLVTKIHLERPAPFSVTFDCQSAEIYPEYQPLSPDNPLRTVGQWSMLIHLPLFLAEFQPDLAERIIDILAFVQSVTSTFVRILPKKLESIRYPAEQYLQYLHQPDPVYFGPLTMSFSSRPVIVPHSPGCVCSEIADPWGSHIKTFKHFAGLYPDLSLEDIRALADRVMSMKNS